jgi:hypothetical protein
MAFISTSLYHRDMTVRADDGGYVYIELGLTSHIGFPFTEIDALIDNLYEQKQRAIAITSPVKIQKLLDDSEAKLKAAERNAAMAEAAQ